MNNTSAKLLFQEAFVTYQAGKLSLALDQLERALGAARRESNAGLICACLGLLGEIHRSNGDLDTAEKFYCDALEEAQRAEFPPPYLAIAISSLGEIARDRGHQADARRHYKQALNMIGNMLQHPHYGLLLDRLAEMYFDEGNFSEASRLVQRIITMRETLRDSKGKADALKKLGLLGLCERSMGDLDSAIKHFEQSHDIAGSCGDISTAIIALAEKGFTYAQKGDHSAAVEIFREVISLRKSHHYFEQEVKDRAALAHSLRQMGHYAEALKHLDHNLRASKNKLPTDQEREDRAACYVATDRARDALPILDSLLEEARQRSDHVLEANCLGNLGFAYHTLGELHQAYEFYKQALRLHQKLGDAEGEFRDHANLIEVSKLLGNTKAEFITEGELIHSYLFEEAAQARPDAERNFQKLAEKAEREGNIALQAFALNSLGNIARNAGALEKAIDLYHKALNLGNEVDITMRTVLLNNLGIVYRMLDNFDQAKECYEKAIDIARHEIGPDNPLDLMPRANLAKLYLHMGDIDHADEIYFGKPRFTSSGLDRLMDLDIRVAILDAKGDDPNNLILSLEKMAEVSSEVGIASREAFCYEHLGVIYHFDLSNPNHALEYYDRAIELLQRIDYQSHLARLLYRRAAVRFALEQLNEAYQDMEQAIQALEQQQVHLISGAFRQRQRVRSLDWYILTTRICTRLGHIGKAIEYVERARAQNLVSLLSARNICPGPAVPKDLCNQFRKAQAEHRHLDLILLQEQEKPIVSPNLRLFRDQLERQVTELHTLLDKIAAFDQSFPKVFRVEPIRYDEIVKMIPRDCPTAIIEFFVVSGGAMVFVIVPGESPLQTSVPLIGMGKEKLYDLLSDRWFKPYIQFCQASRQISHNLAESNVKEEFQVARGRWFENMSLVLSDLYKELFARKSHTGRSVEDCLRGHGIKRIIVIPHGLLHVIPLHATWYLHHGNRRYLMDDYEISYAPSCQVLQYCLSRSSNKHERLVAFADPDNSLSFAKVEVDAISEFFLSPQIFRGAKATLGAVDRALPDAHVSHFSCHGKFDPESPLDSRLVLADGCLDLSTLFERGNVKSGSLVSLSACESGLIRPDRTDEYIGLPSGFLFAGASCVLSSLWPVNDLSTCLLMARIYRNFRRDKMSLSASLREAQSWLRSATSQELKRALPKHVIDTFDNLSASACNSIKPFEHPFYWGAFHVVGASWNTSI